MIASADFTRLAPDQKAALIYAQAHGDVATRLWRAALGGDTQSDFSRTGFDKPIRNPDAGATNLDLLLSLFNERTSPAAAPRASSCNAPASDRNVPYLETEPVLSALETPQFVQTSPSPTGLAAGLGPNARFGPALAAAAARTNIPAAALAAIVDAEAAKGSDGSWQTGSRNPRSSAAGLGQFLGGTWQSEAERAGTWLNSVAASQGWLDGEGRVLPSARSTLLALRYDATASINATADYASRSVSQLKRAGIAVGADLTAIARTAYLGHHLGTGDAVRFLTEGLPSGRARQLLNAQIGGAAADEKIARSGDASYAHRAWLLDYVDRHVTPGRFAS